MDSNASYGAPIDTFSPSFSTDNYSPVNFSISRANTSPEVGSQHFVSEHSPSTSEAVTSSRSATSPTNGNALASGVNPRSCTTCRKRKVRCDKKHPCSNCHKAGIECIFPRPGRAPRRSKKPPDSELLARLRRLEGVVQSLGKGADGEDLVPELEERIENQQKPKNDESEESQHALGRPPGCKRRDMVSDGSTELDKDLGRLFVGDGKSRYVSNSFWANLTNEVAEMHNIIDNSSEEEEDYPTPDSNPSSSHSRQNHTTFIFGYSSTMITLRILHPPKDQISIYWDLYKENVDPLIRLLHRPTVEQLVLKASQNLDALDKGTEALMFAIYLVTVTSLNAEQCQSLLQQDKEISIQRYRFGAEQALARAGFLETNELMVLQAFTLFLVSARRYDDGRFVWTMTGIATRIANAMGLHRDGAQFRLDPFETEMRRRLWWQVCTLDIRASEDQSSDPTITEQSFDTKLPSNINDEDIWPGMSEPPVEHEGCTEMTFDLIRYEVGNTARFLNYTPPGVVSSNKQARANTTIEEKERLIEKLGQYLEARYLRYCDMAVPLQWIAANVARLILAKMWLIVHHPFKRTDGGAGLSQETKDRLFRTSVDVIRYSNYLESQKSTMKWGWLFRTYIQWHAVAFVLSELCTRTLGPEIDSTWELIDTVFKEWSDTISKQNKSMLWKPIRRLMIKARLARSKALEKATLYPSDGSLGKVETPPGPRMPLPESLDGSSAFLPIPPRMDEKPQFDAYGTPSTDTFQGDSVMDALSLDTDASQQWVLDDPTLLQDTDENMTWEGWDNLVKDFSMETMQDQPLPLSMGSWW
ncbi:hypothetical protein MMC11_007161 [Xylographa trunciseda]|nr:hypothetical protein [Xylographa trunciseda]